MRYALVDIFCAVILVMSGGCGPVLPVGGDTGSASTGVLASADGTNTTEVVPTSGMAGSASTSTTSADTGTTATSGEEETFVSIILRPDLPEGPCDPYSQNCPNGEKCTWYASGGGSSWNETKCVPILENPKQDGESCFAEFGGVSGIDDCDLGLMCWDVDLENHGVCVALCHGLLDAALCYAPTKTCVIYSRGLSLCLDTCDPLLQDCVAGDVCIRNYNDGKFLCVLDASGEEGQQHDPCFFANSCDPGLVCNEPTAAVECDQNGDGCCEPICDLSDPDADASCGGVGQVCSPYQAMALEGYENVGYCAVPK